MAYDSADWNGERWGEGGGSKQTGVIAADVEVVLVGIAIADHAGLEVVAARRGDGRVGRRVGGIRRRGGEGEG